MRIILLYTFRGGWRPLRQRSSQLRRPQYNALIHLYRQCIFAYETCTLFPLLGKGIPITSKNSSACAYTHIGHEENYI